MRFLYAAVHVALSVPQLRTAKAIAVRLGLSIERIRDVLGFLVSVGLAKSEGDSFQIGPQRIHLGEDSLLLAKHHLHWRIHGMQLAESRNGRHGAGLPRDLQYTSMVSVSRSDVEKIKSLWVKTIEGFNQIVKESPEEELYLLTVDFLRV